MDFRAYRFRIAQTIQENELYGEADDLLESSLADEKVCVNLINPAQKKVSKKKGLFRWVGGEIHIKDTPDCLMSFMAWWQNIDHFRFKPKRI